MGSLHVMDLTGDTKTIWNPEVRAEIDQAKKTFDDLRAKGYTAYRVDENGKKAQIMTTFDPAAGKIILSPAMAGG